MDDTTSSSGWPACADSTGPSKAKTKPSPPFGFDPSHIRQAPGNNPGWNDECIKFQRLSCSELDAATYNQEYLIERTLVAGQPAILAGPKKAMKTTVMIDMAISLATAKPMLGKLAVNRAARVAVMSGESGLATIQETARRIARAKGFELSAITGLIWSDSVPRLDDAHHLKELGRFLDDELEVLFIDPTYLAMPGDDAGNLFRQGALLRNVTDVCNQRGVTLVLVHHNRKNVTNPFAPPELEDIAWAGFQEFARQWLLLGRRVKYVPGSGEHQLWLNVGGSAGHSALWGVDAHEGEFDPARPREWHVEVKRHDEVRQDAEDQKQQSKKQKHTEQLKADKQKIVGVLAKAAFKDGETKTSIRDQTGLNGRRFAVALAELIGDELIVSCTVQKGNRKTGYDGYRLSESA